MLIGFAITGWVVAAAAGVALYTAARCWADSQASMERLAETQRTQLVARIDALEAASQVASRALTEVCPRLPVSVTATWNKT